MNLMQIIQLIRGGQNPQQLVLSLLNQSSNPIQQNLLQLAQNNDTAGIEQVARNLCQQRGINFDEAFNSFKQQLGI